MSLTLEEAKEAFVDLLKRLNNRKDSQILISWIHETWEDEDHGVNEQEGIILNNIAADLRQMLPYHSTFPSENITFPVIGSNSDCTPQNTVHVDSFLYDDEAIEDLCKDGLLSHSYCKDCGSHNTEDLTYISHSASRERAINIFTGILPSLDGKVVIDIGSRTGVVLYVGYLYSNARKLIGIEINADFCNVQSNIIKKYEFEDKIEIVCGDMCEHENVIQSADVIILNNSFDFFQSIKDQIVMWQFLHKFIKPGTLLVTAPSLEDTLQHLDTGFILKDWVEDMLPHNASNIIHNETETTEVILYSVKDLNQNQ